MVDTRTYNPSPWLSFYSPQQETDLGERRGQEGSQMDLPDPEPQDLEDREQYQAVRL